MVFFGWTIKLIDELDVDIPELKSVCDKHKLNYKLVIAKKYHHLYFVPVDYPFAPERVFMLCDKCNSDYLEIPNKYENIILDYYHQKISLKDLRNKIALQSKDYNEQAKAESKEDEDNFKAFLRMISYIIVFLIFLLIIKFLFF